MKNTPVLHHHLINNSYRFPSHFSLHQTLPLFLPGFYIADKSAPRPHQDLTKAQSFQNVSAPHKADLSSVFLYQ